MDTLQGYAAWWIVRKIIIWLDTKIPLLENPVKRTGIQILITSVAGVGFLILSTEVLSWLIYGKGAITSFYTLDALIFVIWFLVINGVYIALLLFNQVSKKETEASGQEGILVRSGRNRKVISTEEIQSINVDSGLTHLRTIHSEKFVLDESLDHWEEKLPEIMFFRINRKTILNRSSVSGFTSLDHGKLKAQLIERNSDLELGISRAKAPSFKRWFLPKS